MKTVRHKERWQGEFSNLFLGCFGRPFLSSQPLTTLHQRDMGLTCMCGGGWGSTTSRQLTSLALEDPKHATRHTCWGKSKINKQWKVVWLGIGILFERRVFERPSHEDCFAHLVQFGTCGVAVVGISISAKQDSLQRVSGLPPSTGRQVGDP